MFVGILQGDISDKPSLEEENKRSMSETAVCGACVQALYFNGQEWVPFSKGYTRLDIYKDATSYRLVGIKLEDMNVKSHLFADNY